MEEQRFIDNCNGTITDTLTGLMWQEGYAYRETGNYIKWYDAKDYIKKFRMLLEGLVSEKEQERFLKLVQRLPELSESEVCQINVVLDETQIETGFVNKEGIF
mgnify:CR=1 FL=1